jgi:hypothetical protein
MVAQHGTIVDGQDKASFLEQPVNRRVDMLFVR